jgi:hypothetical protein
LASASDVPARYDVVINSEGYIFPRQDQDKAVLGQTPTFVSRTNTQGNYGDEQQDFFLTATQKDWSLGEQQRFFRMNDEESRRSWRTTAASVRVPGQVSMRKKATDTTFGQAIVAVLGKGNGSSVVWAAGSTLLYGDAGGAAHGLGAAPSRYGLATDGSDLYLSTTSGGTVGVRKWDGAAFSTFSATAADSLAFLNNTLYGLRGSDAKLVRYDTAGAATDIFQWKGADGGARTSDVGRIRAMGGDLAILWSEGPTGAELWLYDGTAPALIAAFPHNFYAYDLETTPWGTFVSGLLVTGIDGSSNTIARPSIFYYVNGTVGELWRADSDAPSTGLATNNPSLMVFDNGLLFNDDTTSRLLFYDPSSGGISGFVPQTATGDPALLAGSSTQFIFVRSTTGLAYPDDETATTSTVTTSLFDFDSSLTKLMRGIKVEFNSASDGNGGTVDIAYRVEDVDGAYTTLQTGAVSGTEYTLSGVTGRSISVKVTLNKGTSTNGPVLKRISVRAAPRLQNFRRARYALDLTGVDDKPETHAWLNDGTRHPKSGVDQAADLRTAFSTSAPFTITDALGSYTGIVEDLEIRQIRGKNREFQAIVTCREV